MEKATGMDEEEIFSLQRPDPSLWVYYLLRSLLFGPLFPVALLPLYFRYRTMRYRFDRQGISMSWGVLFHREINLTYSRIQDIHLSSNLVERWLNLARIEIQTASGSAKAEITIEGIPQYEAVRDFLYRRMRGMRDPQGPRLASSPGVPLEGEAAKALALILREMTEELKAVRSALEKRSGQGGT